MPQPTAGRRRRLRARDERGAELVEFALVLLALPLLLCGLIDFGFIFGGYITMGNGVASAARAASLDAYQYSGSTCSGGPSTDTADMICNVVADLGSLPGIQSSTLTVGICFAAAGDTPSCSGQSSTGTSITDDVIVCAEADLTSTTGLTSSLVSGKHMGATSRLLLEQPQPSGATAYEAYDASSSAVTYDGVKVEGMNCS